MPTSVTDDTLREKGVRVGSAWRYLDQPYLGRTLATLEISVAEPNDFRVVVHRSRDLKPGDRIRFLRRISVDDFIGLVKSGRLMRGA